MIMILLLYIYFAFSFRSLSTPPKFENSENVKKLTNRFLNQLKLSQNNPSQTIKDKLPIPDNPLFTRTRTVQYLFDYITAATKELHRTEYNNNDPHYHHTKCIETSTPGMETYLNRFELAVKQFLAHKKSIFHQHVIKQYVQKEIISEKNNGGLSSLNGQYGLTAKINIPRNTVIGHYYGDEYLLHEYEAAFPWNVYGTQIDHPFKKKWDYYRVYHIQYLVIKD